MKMKYIKPIRIAFTYILAVLLLFLPLVGVKSEDGLDGMLGMRYSTSIVAIVTGQDRVAPKMYSPATPWKTEEVPLFYIESYIQFATDDDEYQFPTENIGDFIKSNITDAKNWLSLLLVLLVMGVFLLVKYKNKSETLKKDSKRILKKFVDILWQTILPWILIVLSAVLWLYFVLITKNGVPCLCPYILTLIIGSTVAFALRILEPK